MGVPVDRMVRGDELERELWARITTRAGELKMLMMRNQATLTANALARVFR